MSEMDVERRIARALRAPVVSSPRAKAAIMENVRRAARDGVPPSALPFAGGRASRNALIGVALAASIGSITTLSTLGPAGGVPRADGAVTSTVIGDSVVDRVRDTLRLVRLMFDAPSARQVAVIGDFNGWHTKATPMQRDLRTGRWSVTLALHDGQHRYAIVVDNTRRIGDAAVRSGEASAHVYSLLHVARAAN